MTGGRSVSIIKATALEVLSEPLSLLVTLSALAITVLAPAFHYHQFGEATRMARDAGFSALFTCGGVLAVFATIRAFRREIESGTLEMALAHPVSRSGFFIAKSAGAAVALLVFFAIVFGTAAVIIWGAAVGGQIAERTGDIPRVFGPALAAGVAIMLLPLVVGAALNRFRRARFVLTSFAAALALAMTSLAAISYLDGWRLVLAHLPAAVLVAMPEVILLAAAAAFSFRFRANASASAVAVVALALLPAVGNYYRPDALANGGEIGWGYVVVAALAALPAVAAFVVLGIHFGNRVK